MSAPAILHLSGTVVIDDFTTLPEVWVVDGRFTFSPPRLGPGDRAQTLTGTVVPGLVDVHSHIGLDAAGATSMATAMTQAKADRDTGVLLIRDAGSPLDTSELAGRADLPKILRCGRHLARPKRYIRNYAAELESPGDLPAALTAQARRGDGWTKIVADWIDRDHGDLLPLWGPAELTEAIAGAHAAGARVTAHTFATESIDALLDAGIDCLEHGTGMTPAQMDRAADLGVPVTATLLQVGQFAAIAAAGAEKFPRFAARMNAMHAARYDQVLALHRAGVQILVGTDAGGTIAHGQIAAECGELVAAGIPPAVVVALASYRARDFLGVPGIEEGAPADAVVYARDPRLDIGALWEPAAVILGGIWQQ